MEYFKKNYHYLAILLVLIIYIITLAPSVMEIDTGELAAVQSTLGIAHPTGYPLFTMIGYLFLKIPLPLTKIYQANLLAALYCTAALLFFMKSLIVLFDFSFNQNPIHQKEKRNRKKDHQPVISYVLTNFEKIFIAVITTFILAFNLTFWQQSVSTEVYSLQALLFSLIFYFAIKFFTTEKPSVKECLLLSAALAIGFTNHMTTLLFIPGLAYLFFAKMGFSKSVFKKIGLMALVFFGVLAIVYSYLFIRAAQNPSLNWGNTFDFEHFYRHVSGKQYQVWMFSSIEAAKTQLGNYITGLPAVFAYIPLIFSVIGIFRVYRLNKKLFTFFLITYLFSVLYTINYSIHDLESYFLLSYMILSVFTGYGLAIAFNWGKNKFNNAKLNYAVPGLIVVFAFILNFSKADSSGVYVYEDYTKTILNSVPQNSIVFSYQWDYLISPSYYFQKVENYRRDVVIIDKELLRRSWYYNQMETNYPDVIRNIKPEINAFLTAVKPFEQDKEFNSATLEVCYQTIMTKLITENISSRDYFIAPELFEYEMQSNQFKLPQGCSLVPYGLLFKVVTGTGYTAGPPVDFKIRLPKERDAYTSFIYNQTGAMLLRRALYEIQFNKKEEAGKILQKIKNELPEYIIPEQILKKI